MIYKDRCAYLDAPHKPYKRVGEDCLHCGEGWEYHHGWACDRWYDIVDNEVDFNKVRAECRYLTQSMKDSIIALVPEKVISVINHATEMVKEDILQKRFDDWRSWAHNRPGECACGIARVQCIYHR